jgi:hypothetical protein
MYVLTLLEFGNDYNEELMNLLRCCTSPITINPMLKVQHSKPPYIYIKSVVGENILWIKMY